MAQVKQPLAKSTSYQSKVQGVAVRERLLVYRAESTGVLPKHSGGTGILIANSVWAPHGTWVPQRTAYEQVQELDTLHTVTAGYELRNGEQVVQFLQDHVYLWPLLKEARHYISMYFGSLPPALEVVADPDGGTSIQLIISILTSLSPESALECLDALDDWWLDVLPRARRKLNITLEYV